MDQEAEVWFWDEVVVVFWDGEEEAWEEGVLVSFCDPILRRNSSYCQYQATRKIYNLENRIK